MHKFILCFIFDENGGYRPLPYELIAPNGSRSPEYAKRYFLPLHGYLLEVSQEDYLSFYQEQRRYRYLAERARKKRDLSYSKLEDDERQGEAILRDIYTDVEEEVIRSIMAEKLHHALALLPKEDQALICMIYFDEQSEARCGEVLGVSKQAVNARKKRILEKLRKIFEI